MIRTARVAIVGGGPSGLRAARELAPAVSGDVVVLEREREAGGFPRHCDHTGFGVRDEHRLLTGRQYARRIVRAAEEAGALVRTGAVVTGWSADGGVEVTTPQGLWSVRAEAVVLATGAYERPRAARLIPGDRPAGVYTTGLLRGALHRDVGRRAVVVGSGPVALPAIRVLRRAGYRVVLVTDREDRVACAPGSPVWTSSRVSRVVGGERVRAVEVESGGHRQVIACETVVFTGDQVPNSELFDAAGLDLDPGTRGPVVDTAWRTERPGAFAAGTVVHPAGGAALAARGGVQVARSVLDHLAGRGPRDEGVRLVAEGALRWIAPAVHRRGDPPADLLAWADQSATCPRVVLQQGGRVVAEKRLLWTVGQLVRIPGGVLRGLRPGEVRISLHR